MSHNRFSFTSISVLALVGCGLLLWSAYLLVYYISAGVWGGLPEHNGISVYMGAAIITLVLGAMALILVLVASIIMGYTTGWLSLMNEDGTETDQWFEELLRRKGPALRRLQLFMLSMLGTYYVVFLQESMAVTAAWNIVLPLLFLLVPRGGDREEYATMAISFAVMLFFGSTKLVFTDDSTSVYTLAAYPMSALIAFPLATIIVFWKVELGDPRRSQWLWRLALSFLSGGVATLLYFVPLLGSVNCLLDKAPGKIYYAEVYQKCPPGSRLSLSVVMDYEGHRHAALIEVTRRFYNRCLEGDYMDVIVHKGYFGWPWHQNMQYQSLTDHLPHESPSKR